MGRLGGVDEEVLGLGAAGESCVVFLCFDRQNVNNRYSLSLRRIPTATKGFKEK